MYVMLGDHDHSLFTFQALIHFILFCNFKFIIAWGLFVRTWSSNIRNIYREEMPYFCLIRGSCKTNQCMVCTWSLRNICRMHNYPGKLIYKYRGLGPLSAHQWVGVRAGNSFMPTRDAGVCIQIDRKPPAPISNIAVCVNLITGARQQVPRVQGLHKTWF